LEAVVLAAGEGTRLRPLTERWPKAVLPVDGRPVVATLLRELAAAGVGRVTVVVGHLAPWVERLCGDGSAFGVEVAYARQPRALGSADALARALETGIRSPLVVSAADTVYTPGDLAGAAERFVASGAAAGLGVRPVPAADVPSRSLVEVEGGLVRRLAEKPAATGVASGTAVAGAPLWFVASPLLRFLDGLPGPPFELAEAFRRAIQVGEQVAALPLGPTRDLTRPADLVLHNFPYLWET
jgi:NDP-sugar pyrophosphorylase family protein